MNVFFRNMVITLVIIGILQFLDLPKFLDYTLLVLAIIFAGIGYNKKISNS